MENLQSYLLPRRVLLSAVIIFLFLMFTCATTLAQTTQITPQETELLNSLQKNPELLSAIGEITQRLQRDLQFPAMRSSSTLLPLLPESTNFYIAIPNYGNVAHQALVAFQGELEHNSALREWWGKGDSGKAGPNIADGINKFSQISQYLGDEMVISAVWQTRTQSSCYSRKFKKQG
jgi:hypothetical protein